VGGLELEHRQSDAVEAAAARAFTHEGRALVDGQDVLFKLPATTVVDTPGGDVLAEREWRELELRVRWPQVARLQQRWCEGLLLKPGGNRTADGAVSQ
jgi:hypothetical protein